MADVARAAGVSKITVSRVLRVPGKVKPETRARVEAAVRDLGYVPDDLAGSLSSRESRIVTAVLSTLAGSTFASTVDSLSDQLRRHGRQLLLANTDYSAESEERLIMAALSRRTDGLVLTSTDHTAGARALLRRASVPIIELWGLPSDPIDMAVGFSNRQAGAAIARFLVETGHQRLGFIGGAADGDSRGRLRLEGYSAEIWALGRYAPIVAPAASTQQSSAERGAKGLRHILNQDPDASAVFCVSDSVALGALLEAWRRGLAVPRQLAIVGFGDFDFAGKHGLGLTTVRVPARRIGETAAELLLESNTSTAPRGTVVDLGFSIMRRQTA